MNLKYFRLYEECYLINGKEEACIYDLFNEKVFHINRELKKILTLAESNKCIEEICKALNIDKATLEIQLKEVENFQVGGFFDTPPAIEKVTLNPNWQDYLFFNFPLQLDNAFIELTGKCDKDCFFCNSSKYFIHFRCMGCTKYNSNNNTNISITKWKEYLEQLYVLNIQNLYITGGNIFLDVRKLKTVLLFAKEIGFKNITVISCNCNININAVMYLKKEIKNIKFIIQCYLDKNYKDTIENDNIINNISVVNSSNYFFIFLLKYCNKSLINNICNILLHKIQKGSFIFDYLLDIENITNSQLQEIKFINDKITLDYFSIKEKFHPCLKSTISILSDKIITTCPGLRDYPLSETGDIFEAIKAENRDKYSLLSCNKISPCNQCEYRYMCNDCRYIELINGAQLNQTKLCGKCRLII